jgi:hypothetical protein
VNSCFLYIRERRLIKALLFDIGGTNDLICREEIEKNKNRFKGMQRFSDILKLI